MMKAFSGKDGKWTPERSMVTWSFHTKSPEQLCPKLNQRLPGISSAKGKGNLKIRIEWELKTEKKKESNNQKKTAKLRKMKKGRGKKSKRKNSCTATLWKLKGHMWFLADSWSSPSSVSLTSCLSHPRTPVTGASESLHLVHLTTSLPIHPSNHLRIRILQSAP